MLFCTCGERDWLYLEIKLFSRFSLNWMSFSTFWHIFIYSFDFNLCNWTVMKLLNSICFGYGFFMLDEERNRVIMGFLQNSHCRFNVFNIYFNDSRGMRMSSLFSAFGLWYDGSVQYSFESKEHWPLRRILWLKAKNLRQASSWTPKKMVEVLTCFTPEQSAV